jgi:hypothetical protein
MQVYWFFSQLVTKNQCKMMIFFQEMKAQRHRKNQKLKHRKRSFVEKFLVDWIFLSNNMNAHQSPKLTFKKPSNEHKKVPNGLFFYILVAHLAHNVCVKCVFYFPSLISTCFRTILNRWGEWFFFFIDIIYFSKCFLSKKLLD